MFRAGTCFEGMNRRAAEVGMGGARTVIGKDTSPVAEEVPGL